jgi:hypothetical protein
MENTTDELKIKNFKDRITSDKEDTYTDYLHFRCQIIDDDGIYKHVSVLIGDVTQVEYGDVEDGDGFRTLVTTSFITEDGNIIQSSRGFCATINTKPIIYKYWSEVPVIEENGQKYLGERIYHGTTSFGELHAYPETIYRDSEKESELFESYTTRSFAKTNLIEEFIKRNQDLIKSINILTK